MAAQRFMVVIDPTMNEHPAFERALETACATSGELYLYTCTCKAPEVHAGETEAVAFMRFRAEVRDAMRELGARAEAAGLRSRMEIACAPDFRQEMVQAAAREHADLVFKYSWAGAAAPQRASRVPRAPHETADWLLMRLAPCPVLMVKNARSWSTRRFLGAINFGAHDLAHIKLNNQIVAETRRLAEDFGAEAHFVSAWADPGSPPDAAEFARVCGVPPERAHVAQGQPATAIHEAAERLAADLILIGTVARSGMLGTIVGNTAERVLAETLSDVLVLN